MRAGWKWGVRLLAMLGLLTVGGTAGAKTFCVATLSDLDGALGYWRLFSTDDETVTIKLVQGTFTVDNAGGATLGDYDPQSTADLKLLGGYGAGCNSRTIAPGNTVIDGDNQAGSKLSLAPNAANVTVEGISFRHLKQGVEIVDTLGGSAFGKKATVRFCIFSGMSLDNTPNTAALQVFLMNGMSAQVEDNLIVGNSGGQPASALSTTASGGSFILVVNNTVVNNAQSGWRVFAGSDSPIQGYNNILWGNSTDLNTAFSDAPPYIGYTTYGSKSGLFISNGNNSTANPLFLGANDFHLTPLSPAVNSGAPEAVIVSGYPSHDLEGGPRQIGSAVDRGAIESTVDDLNAFTVTNANDSGAGSLRQAILDANGDPGFSRISFNIQGGCPQLITLNSPLPDITTPVWLDAYSQPGASANTLDTGFDANLCVVLMRNTNFSVPHALRVQNANGRLVLSGFGLGGFTTAAVILNAGSRHFLSGNRFGAQGFVLGNADAVQIGGSASDSSVGAAYPGNRNVIGGNSGNGVLLGGSGGGNAVINNYIGLDESGAVARPNSYGVVIDDSAGNSVVGNAISGNSHFGVEISGANASNNAVSTNLIGYAADYSKTVANAWGGVYIHFGAASNAIGWSPVFGGIGNGIYGNGGPGVWVNGNAGGGNRINGNGIHSNSGLAIDLGAGGSTPNDLFDVDGGGNGGQNFPVLASALRTADGDEALQGTLATFTNDAFRIEFYWSPWCKPDGRGEMAIYLGSTSVQTNGSGLGNIAVVLPMKQFSGGYVSAIATATNGDTSEPGPCVAETFDRIFADGFDE